MKLTVKGLFSKEALINNFDKVEEQLLKDGKVIITSGERVYELSVTNLNDLTRSKKQLAKRDTLPRAMKFILDHSETGELHATDIAREINEMEIYVRKDGKPLDGVQVRSCANNNSDIFESLEKNLIRLKVDKKFNSIFKVENNIN